MRCFNHAENRAVGLCKNCSKGLCHDCLTDLGNGLACKTQCEERTKALNEHNDLVIANGLKSLNLTKGYYIYYLFFGFLMSGLGLFLCAHSGFDIWSIFYLLLGGLFIVSGWRQRKIWK